MAERKKITYAREDEPVVKCDKCPEKIFFKKMKSGKYMPVNCDDGQPHWATCPAATQFRKRR